MPKVHQSTADDCPEPLITSGAMYSSVPTNEFVSIMICPEPFPLLVLCRLLEAHHLEEEVLEIPEKLLFPGLSPFARFWALPLGEEPAIGDLPLRRVELPLLPLEEVQLQPV